MLTDLGEALLVDAAECVRTYVRVLPLRTCLLTSQQTCAPRHHNVGLLPWSVLCGGLLSGKYAAAARAPAAADARFVKFDDYMSRWHPKHARPSTLAAADAYAAIAERAGLSPTELAILWCRTRPFVAHGSVIVGATSVAQLRHNLDAFSLPAARLTEEIEAEIDAVHVRCRDPSNSL